LPKPSTLAGRPDFLQELQAIWADPRIRRIAWSRAGDPDLVEDTLQEAYCAVAQHRNPAAIRDLRAYFVTTLLRKIQQLRGQLGAVPVDDVETLADTSAGKNGDNRPQRPFDETVGTSLLARAWLRRLAAERESVAATVPSRSSDPGRYRCLIVSVAEQVLRANVTADVSDADSDPALVTAYPEWFAQEGCGTDNAYQRFSRARADVRSLLQAIISREDLDR
jgi:DNA-directed RNA polymerase specialized sigma24 family protein